MSGEIEFSQGLSLAPDIIRLGLEDFRVSVRGRDQAKSDRSPDSFCHSALVSRPEARELAVLDLAHLRHVLGHHAEVLREIQGQHSLFASLIHKCLDRVLGEHTL